MVHSKSLQITERKHMLRAFTQRTEFHTGAVVLNELVILGDKIMQQ